MSTFLETILARKKDEVALLRKRRRAVGEFGPVPQRRDFCDAICAGQGLGIIAEVKKSSPSRGIIRGDFDPVAVATAYDKAGANAVSVLTDEHFFGGSTADLVAVRNAIGRPVLRKDFIIDTAQVEETAAIGADAVLLIAAALDDYRLRDLYQASCESGIQPLMEVHDGGELDRVMALDPPLVGINNRNLSTFVTDISVTLELVSLVPREVKIVSESGIERAEQAKTLRNAGVGALLVGESLMRLGDPADLIKELREA